MMNQGGTMNKSSKYKSLKYKSLDHLSYIFLVIGFLLIFAEYLGIPLILIVTGICIAIYRWQKTPIVTAQSVVLDKHKYPNFLAGGILLTVLHLCFRIKRLLLILLMS